MRIPHPTVAPVLREEIPASELVADPVRDRAHIEVAQENPLDDHVLNMTVRTSAALLEVDLLVNLSHAMHLR